MGDSPWLDGVSNLTAFDAALSNYVANTFVTYKYVIRQGTIGLASSPGSVPLTMTLDM